MDATLICFVLEKVTQTQRTALNRELNGYTDISNKGKYRYKRKGVMDTVPHIRPHKSVFIVKKDHKNVLLKILRKYGAKIKSYDIKIQNQELR